MPLTREAHGLPPLQLWVGLEGTLNRVGDTYYDQLALAGHYDRPDDIDRLAGVGVRTVRYPVVWERLGNCRDGEARWKWHDQQLARMRELGIEPILGLVHHGSGPRETSLLDESFATGLAEFARRVATRYPWVTR